MKIWDMVCRLFGRRRAVAVSKLDKGRRVWECRCKCQEANGEL